MTDDGSESTMRGRGTRGKGLSAARPYLSLLLLLGSCKPPPEEQQHMPGANLARGREVIARVGCGSCHVVPGLYWPRGSVGPSLAGFSDRSLIAGVLPNRPDVLSQFVRDAPALLPDTTMPAMPMTEEESRDVAAYLYAFGDH